MYFLAHTFPQRTAKLKWEPISSIYHISWTATNSAINLLIFIVKWMKQQDFKRATYIYG